MRARVVLSALCIAVACSGGDGQPDACGGDAAIDASFDEAQDASTLVDAMLDTSLDSNRDAALTADDPGWLRSPGFPDECYVERARQPEAVMAFHWAPCVDGLPNCMMSTIDRSVAPLASVTGIPGGGDVLLWSFEEQHFGIYAMTREDHVVLAWRLGPYADHHVCMVSAAASELGTGMEIWSGTGSSFLLDHIVTAPWSNLGRLDDPPFVVSSSLVAPGDFLEAPSASDTTFAAMTTTGHIVAVEPPMAAAILGDGSEPVVVGHRVLWNWGDAAGATAIHLGTLGGAETELYRAPSGTHLYGVRGDGAWVTWRAGADDPTGAHFPLNELWAAPYSETGPLTGQRSWTDLVNSGRSGTIGDGMFAYDGYDTALAEYAIYVVRLSDGARFEYALPFDAAPGGVGWGIATDPAWVTRDEVVFPAGRTHGAERLHTALRIDLTALVPVPHP